KKTRVAPVGHGEERRPVRVGSGEDRLLVAERPTVPRLPVGLQLLDIRAIRPVEDEALKTGEEVEVADQVRYHGREPFELPPQRLLESGALGGRDGSATIRTKSDRDPPRPGEPNPGRWRSDVVADPPAGADADLPVHPYAHVAPQHVDVDRTPVETAGIVPVVPEAEVTGPEHRLLGLGAGESLVMRTQAQLPHEGGGVVGLHGLPEGIGVGPAGDVDGLAPGD